MIAFWGTNQALTLYLLHYVNPGLIIVTYMHYPCIMPLPGLAITGLLSRMNFANPGKLQLRKWLYREHQIEYMRLKFTGTVNSVVYVTIWLVSKIMP